MEKNLLNYLRKQNNITILAEEGENFLAKQDDVCIHHKDNKLELFKFKNNHYITSNIFEYSCIKELELKLNKIKEI